MKAKRPKHNPGSEPTTIRNPKFLKPPNKGRRSDEIASQIKNWIISNRIDIGQKLPAERELAESLSVSRVVIREALKSLGQSGFIETRLGARGGSFVSNKIYKPFFGIISDLLRDGALSLHHFCEAREAVEKFSMELAVEHIKDEDIDRLRSINMKLLDDMSNSARFPYSNMEFHVGISEISRNPLAKLLVTALLQTLIMVYPSSPQSPKFIEATYERHCKILEAMGIRDVSLCMACLHEDVEVTRNLMV